MNKLFLIPVFLVSLFFLFPSALALSSSPTSLNFNATLNSPTNQTVTITTNSSFNFSSSNAPYSFTSGNLSGVISISPSSFSIPTSGTQTLTVTASTSSAGYWSGVLQISGNQTNTSDNTVSVVSISIPITVKTSIFQITSWFNQGNTINLSPSGYAIGLSSVTSGGATIIISRNGVTLFNQFVANGNNFNNTDLTVALLDTSVLSSNQAKLQITESDPSTTYTVTSGTTTGSTIGQFSFFTTQYANTVSSGTDVKIPFILLNSLNVSISLKEVDYSGTVISALFGQQPIVASSYQLGTMSPGAETTFIVDINTMGLSSGQWTPVMTVKGLDQNGNIISASITFLITVTQSIVAPSSGNVTVTCPSNVNITTPFSIFVNGLSSGMTVDMQDLPQLVASNITVSGGTWEWDGIANSVVNQNVSLTIKLLGGVFKTLTCDLSTPSYTPLYIGLSEQRAWVGDNVIITTTPVNATISLNGNTLSTPYTFVPIATGNYQVSASASGYQSSNVTLTVINPVNFTSTGGAVGDRISLNFTDNGVYYVKTDNGTIIASGSGSSLSFTPTSEGTYKITDDTGHNIGSVTVKANFFSGIWSYIAGILVIAVVILLVKFALPRVKRGGGSSRIGIGGPIGE